MKAKPIPTLLLTLLLLPAVTGQAQEVEVEADESDALRIGRMVLEIQAALAAPNDPQSLETIVEHGTDSRHYVMIRGWLVQLLAGAESQHKAARAPELKGRHAATVEFLKRAIRRIDLE